ncbi:PLP-dependent transferase [Thozetella sp. PMI_491]|nr:PLP-dependent transferase [Thozetella sp. PMI_491]
MAHPFVTSSNILHRSFAPRPEKVVSASGVSLFLESGREILDASAGPAVSCLGHGRPEIADVVADQIRQLAYLYSGARFTCEATEELATLLLGDRPGGLSKAIFVNSGSEATDAAIKLATQYWHERGLPRKQHVIARKQSYHGNTIGALCVSGHTSRRAMYGDWLSNNVSFVDPCHAYRLQEADETEDGYVQRLAAQLEGEILRIGPENIMCGMGKTGTMHAWEQEGISGPDIQTVGKALGGGFVPLSGIFLREKIFEALASGSGGLQHGHTFQAHPAACAAAVKVQNIIRDEDLLGNVTRMGNVLERLLREEIGTLAFVGDIRGRGLFWAVEFMLDKEKRMPFPADAKFCDRVVERALELGLNILGNLGTTGDVHVELVILSPPYVVNEEELRRMVAILKNAIQDISTSIQR